ncbi:MAG: hypothetical protein ACYCV1_01910 [Acidimicrobiales bacterium]
MSRAGWAVGRDRAGWAVGRDRAGWAVGRDRAGWAVGRDRAGWATTGRQRRVPTIATVMVLCILGASAWLATAAPVAAVSATPLTQFLTANPEPGWQQAPATSVQPIVSRLEKVDTNAAQGQPVDVAAGLWISPSGSSMLGITLVRWPPNIGDLVQTLRAATANECVAVTGNDPGLMSSEPGIPGSLVAGCSGSGPGGQTIQENIVAALRGDVSMLVESFGTSPLRVAQLYALAANQYAALPAKPNDSVPAVTAGVLAVAITLALVVLVAYRRRTRLRRPPVTVSTSWYQTSHPIETARPTEASQTIRAPETAAPATYDPVTSAPAGWYPDPVYPMVQHYWDGARYIARARFDGTTWVTAPGADEPT